MRSLTFLAICVTVALSACSQPAPDAASGGIQPSEQALALFEPFNCGPDYPRVTASGEGAEETTLEIPASLRRDGDEIYESAYFVRRGVLSNGALALMGLPVVAFERVVEFDVSVDWVLVDASAARVIERLSQESSAVGGDPERFRIDDYYWPMATGEDGPSSANIYFVDLAAGADESALRGYLHTEESNTTPRGSPNYAFPINSTTLPGAESPYPGRLVVLAYGDNRALVGCHYQPS
jgi:hypothetical protein